MRARKVVKPPLNTAGPKIDFQNIWYDDDDDDDDGDDDDYGDDDDDDNGTIKHCQT